MMFARASTIFDTQIAEMATLPAMREKKASEVGERIRTLMADKKIPDRKELHRLVLELAQRNANGLERTGKHKKQTLTPQTVSNWIGGKVVPSWDMIPLLAQVLGTEEDYLVFGSKRRDQIRSEKQYLSRVNDEEAALLTAFRESSKSGQKTILKLARDVAEDHPAPEATVHPMRRKDDKLKS
jgi:transcriptional regulator with XRE-family HTH domain